jgi:nucleolin
VRFTTYAQQRKTQATIRERLRLSLSLCRHCCSFVRMVLSNKKLKQRLRAELAESLTKTVIESDPRKPDLNAQPQLSLKELIDSAASKPRLTKREKRRKIISLQGPEAVKSRRSSVGGESEENKGDKKEKEGGSESLVEKKKKKRKREDEEEVVKEGDLGSEENGVVKEAKKPNKKKKKKGKKKKNKKGKSEEGENNGAELGSEEKVVMETNNNDER